MHPKSNRIVLLSLAAWIVLGLFAHSANAQVCAAATSCRSNGHFTTSAALFPYTEDIASAGYLPHGNVTLSQSTAWTEIQAGCGGSPVLGNNLNGTQAFHAALRAALVITSATAAPGARYEIQFWVDGVAHGWFMRRYQGALPQTDDFEATAQNIPAGPHKLTVMARLLDPGTITFTTQYMTGQGMPIQYPSANSGAAAELTVSTAAFSPVSNSITFTNATAVDIAVQFYAQINSASILGTIQLGYTLDGTIVQKSIVGISQYLPTGTTGTGYILNVAPGTHTLLVQGLASSGMTAKLAFRSVEFVSFPQNSINGATSTTSSITVSTATTQTQPLSLDQGSCGKWTKLLSMTLPADNSLINWYLVGSLGTSSSSMSPLRGEIAYEAVFTPCGTGSCANDMSWLPYTIYPGKRGISFIGDAMLYNDPNVSSTVNLWARLVNGCGQGGPGSFQADAPYMWAIHTPFGGCYYN